MDPQMTPKSLIFASFLVPGPFPEAPGAFLDALRALPVPSGTLQKNRFLDALGRSWGALGALLGALGAILTHFGPKLVPK